MLGVRGWDMIKSYKDLDVWKRSVALVKDIYKITSRFPKEEQFGLISQMKRSAISIPSNIAEGRTRQHTNEYVQFLYIALSSCSELSTQLIISEELNFINKAELEKILNSLDSIGKMVNGLIKSLKREKVAQALTPKPKTLTPNS